MDNLEVVDYQEADKKFKKLVKLSFSYLEKKWLSYDTVESEIKKAYIFARDAHHGTFRLSWEPYIIHPIEASIILLELKPDIHTIQACLMHDVIEDTTKTYEDIKNNFWQEVADLCDWMEKLSKVRYQWEDRNIWSLRKMFVAMSKDLRVIFIKLSDRLHNMQTLKFHPKPEKRERIALETLNIYAPIADRLWLHYFKNMLEEECFKILNYAEYKAVKKELSLNKDTMDSFEKFAKIEVESVLSSSWIKYDVDFRVKSIYSIYKKMKRKNIENISDLYDIYWIKILVNDINECYRVLWIVHSYWTPLPKRFKDYIALPKPNWYKSLHTTVLGLLKDHRQQPTEIQIKTYEMDISSKIWIAAHFEYKEKWSRVANDIDWVKQLQDLTQNLWNNDFMDSLKIDLFKDRIFVLSPKWDSINLPAGSTPIDFAYEIHTDLWNHIVLAKVNWQVVPLDKELKNWDIVEVVKDKNKKPSPFYLSFVKTTKAKNCIRSYLRNEDKDFNVDRWREILNKILEKFNIEKLDKDLSLLKNLDWRTYDMQERNDILEQVWNFSTNPNAVVKKICKTNNFSCIFVSDTPKPQEITNVVNKEKRIIIWWELDIPYTIWKCCEWNLWEKIVSYINSKWVLSVHNRDCRTVLKYPKERMMTAFYEWDDLSNIYFEINFVFVNKIWILKNLSDILFDMNINTIEISSKKVNINQVWLFLKLEILWYDYLLIYRFLDRVKFKIWNDLINYEITKITS